MAYFEVIILWNCSPEKLWKYKLSFCNGNLHLWRKFTLEREAIPGRELLGDITYSPGLSSRQGQAQAQLTKLFLFSPSLELHTAPPPSQPQHPSFVFSEDSKVGAWAVSRSFSQFSWAFPMYTWGMHFKLVFVFLSIIFYYTASQPWRRREGKLFFLP